MELPLADGRTLNLDRPLIMGILNVTPDSFSDGGSHAGLEDAVRHAQTMIAEGADLIDVGGESTRPGSQRVPAAEQKRRVIEVIRQICSDNKKRANNVPASRTTISIDTTLSEVAAAALDAGAEIINDISAGRDDAAMFDLAAFRRVPIVLMHMQGTPQTMQQAPTYQDVVAEVKDFLLARAAAAEAAGVERGRIILDPGIGFGKTREHNLALLAGLERLVATGYPVLLGSSRKRFMGSICTQPGVLGGNPPSPQELVGATCATTVLGVLAGVRMFRVHDVRANRQAADVTYAIQQAGKQV